MPEPPPSLLQRHPWLRACIALFALLATLLGALGYKHHHAETLATEACATALKSRSLGEFRSAMQAKGYALSETMERPGEPVLMVEFPAIMIERFICVVSARGEEVRSAQVNFHD